MDIQPKAMREVDRLPKIASSAQQRVFAMPKLRFAIAAQLDTLSLVRMSATSQLWRKSCNTDMLWRDRMIAERPLLRNCPEHVALQPPAWARHRASLGAAGKAEPCSWRQACRLLGIWERGRPHAATRVPSMLHADGKNICVPDLSDWRGFRSTGPGAAMEEELAAFFGRKREEIRGLCFDDRRYGRLYTADGVAALWNGRERLMVFEQRDGTLREYNVPLRQKGCIASDVALVPLNARAKKSKGADTPDVLCLSRAGNRWIRWDYRRAAMICEIPTQHGYPVEIGDTMLWAGWTRQHPRHDDSWFGLWDLDTAQAIHQYTERHPFVGCAMLTPHFGPLVGWSNRYHFRVMRMTQVERQHRGQLNMLDRPVMVWPYREGDPNNLVEHLRAEDLARIVPDVDCPGHLQLVFRPEMQAQMTHRLLVEGWGLQKKCEPQDGSYPFRAVGQGCVAELSD